MKSVFVVPALLAAHCAMGQLPYHGDGSIAGRVTNSGGVGVPAQVTVLQMRVADGEPLLYASCVTDTNAQGQYQCTTLPAGAYLVQVKQAPSKTTDRGAGGVSFYPGVSDLAQADHVDLGSGGTSVADVRIPDVSPVSITGRLLPSAPEASFTLKAVGNDVAVDTGIPLTYQNQSGIFRAHGLTPGHYLLEADWLVDGSEHKAWVPIVVGNVEVHNLIVKPDPNVTLAGDITKSRGRGDVRNLTLQRVDGVIPDISVPVDKRHFEFPTVPSGEYIVRTEANSGWYVSSISSNNKTVEGARFSTDTSENQQISIDLIGSTATIAGTVKPSETSSELTDVVAVSEESGFVYHTTTDSQQRFSISGVPPGVYHLLAWPGPELVPYRNQTFLQNSLQNSTEVSVSDGAFVQDVSLAPIDHAR